MRFLRENSLSIVFLVCGSRLPLERVRRAALAYGTETTVVAVVFAIQATAASSTMLVRGRRMTMSTDPTMRSTAGARG